MLKTGIPNLDLLLGGGLPKRDMMLIVGPAGSGKTILSLQMAFFTASAGENVLYVSTLSESPAKLLRHLRSLAFIDESLIGRQLFFTNLYPLIHKPLQEIMDALVDSVRKQQIALVVIDGLMNIRDLQGEAELSGFIYDLGNMLATLNCTTLLTSSGIFALTERQSPEYTLVDAVIVMDMEMINTQAIRTLQVRKIRGLAPLLGQHAMRIDTAGITVFPRLESVYKPVNVGLGSERRPLGLPELDAVLGGGPLAGSVTLLAAAMGLGKTLCGLHFISAGLQRGENGLLVSFRETPRQLLDKARVFGLDLDSAVQEGRVIIFYRPPVDLIIDQICWELWNQVESFGPQRVVVDSLVELEYAITSERRHFGYIAALIGLLRNQGVTSLVLKEVAKGVGPELDFTDTPLALLAENVLLFRHVEFENELYRILSVLKMRESAFDPSIRQYLINEKGIKVLTKVESGADLLAAIARQPAEAFVKTQDHSA